MTQGDAHEAVEEVARTSYGRLVAYFAARTGDLAAAEDALADAFEAALRTWPTRGVPERPVSWMITAANRSMIGTHRRRTTAERAAPTLALLAEEQATAEVATIPDKRLELLFTCAHPAIDPTLHAPLMLQAVFGIDAARMAPVFLVPAATLGQRLVRAKRKIADARIPFTVPDRASLAPRTAAVLDAIYAAYGTGWDDPAGLDAGRAGLTTEALRLADLLGDLRPDDPEVLGLAALLHHLHARAAARRDDSGAFVPLTEQDPWRWNPADLATGETLLNRSLTASAAGDRPGPYALLAAISSVHNRRVFTSATDWPTIAALYDRLLPQRPTAGVAVARAVAHMEAGDLAAAADGLAAIEPSLVDGYQPYWTVTAELAARRGDLAARDAAAARAITLTDDPAVRAHLETRWR